jgi:NAD(P)-dependent dehydrogenase (short-subunit alcohol dehydrogenase family)
VRDWVVVVTGATSGIGQIAAEQLAGMGARIVLVARDAARAEATLQRLRSAGPGVEHTAHLADLSLVAEIRRVGDEIAAAEPRVDVLINNAGALFNRRRVTTEGLEMTFALNHMAYFVFTEALLPRLRATAPARIINTASNAHEGARLDFDDLQSARSFSGFGAYGRSKLANILFTRALAKRLDGSGVTANSVHPGFVATRFGEGSGGLIQAILPAAKLFALSPQKGAQGLVYLASSPEAANTSGLYFSGRRPKTPSAAALDDAAAARQGIQGQITEPLGVQQVESAVRHRQELGQGDAVVHRQVGGGHRLRNGQQFIGRGAAHQFAALAIPGAGLGSPPAHAWAAVAMTFPFPAPARAPALRPG